jgi:hypothetical protein
MDTQLYCCSMFVMFKLWTPSYIVAPCLLCSCYGRPVILLLHVCYVHVMDTQLCCCSMFVVFMLWTLSYIVAPCLLCSCYGRPTRSSQNVTYTTTTVFTLAHCSSVTKFSEVLFILRGRIQLIVQNNSAGKFLRKVARVCPFVYPSVGVYKPGLFVNWS